jgi:hypothetical protein
MQADSKKTFFFGLWYCYNTPRKKEIENEKQPAVSF